MSPTLTLEQHLMWDDIAILLRYLLMLSFNNSLDGQCLHSSVVQYNCGSTSFAMPSRPKDYGLLEIINIFYIYDISNFILKCIFLLGYCR